MSGECDQCGEHCLECRCSHEEDKKYPVYGYYKQFSCLCDLIEYAAKFPDMPCDLEFFKRFFEDRIKEIELNCKMRPKFTNRMALSLINICAIEMQYPPIDENKHE